MTNAYPEKPAATDHPIADLLQRRWSPRIFEEGRAVERDKIASLLEAARWAPSCFNDQPWRYLVAHFRDCIRGSVEREVVNPGVRGQGIVIVVILSEAKNPLNECDPRTVEGAPSLRSG